MGFGPRVHRTVTMTSRLDPAPLILEEADLQSSQPVKTPPSPPKRALKELRGLLSDAVYVSSMYQICFADVGGHSSEEEEAEEEERRHDREAIRQKLAMDTDLEECFGVERPSRKPSLAVRLQESKNLQICFMNETAAELDSLELTAEEPGNKANPSSAGLPNGLLNASANVSLLQASAKPAQSAGLSSATRRASLQEEAAPKRPSFFFNRRKSWRQKKADGEAKKEPSAAAEERWSGEDFATRQARLQAEARAALAQAKEMARMQMEVERQQKKKSPIADIVGISFPDSRHRLSRQLLNDMNVAQLQVIVNDLHSQIESHNEDLVKFLLERDDLHMEQDSMLVDIEDMTRFLGAKNSSASQDNPAAVSQPLPAKAVPSK